MVGCRLTTGTRMLNSHTPQHILRLPRHPQATIVGLKAYMVPDVLGGWHGATGGSWQVPSGVRVDRTGVGPVSVWVGCEWECRNPCFLAFQHPETDEIRHQNRTRVCMGGERLHRPLS